jgi:hypothetical protein
MVLTALHQYKCDSIYTHYTIAQRGSLYNIQYCTLTQNKRDFTNYNSPRNDSGLKKQNKKWIYHRVL